jgi:hypothetical protein
MITRWQLDYFAGYDADHRQIWQEVAHGRSRIRAAICLIIAALGRPDRKLRLYWQGTP